MLLECIMVEVALFAILFKYSIFGSSTIGIEEVKRLPNAN